MQAGHTIERGSNVIAGPYFDRSRVQSHAHPYLSYFFGPRLSGNGALGLEGGGKGLGSVREYGPESVTFCAEDVATCRFDSPPQDCIVALDGSLHGLGMVLPAFGAPLYIGEQERHRPTRQVGHRNSPGLNEKKVKQVRAAIY